MQGGMALLTIIAIIAIVVIATAVIVVIANMILGAFGGKKEESEPKTSSYVQEQVNQNNVQEEYDFEAINTAKAEQEQKLAEEAKEELPEEEDIEEEDLSKLEADLANQTNEQPAEEETVAEQQSEEADDADLDDLLDGITNDIVDEEKEKQSEVKMDESLEQYNIDDYLNEEPAEESVEQEQVEEPVEQEATNQVVTQTVNNEELESLKAQLEEANRKLEEARVGVKITTTEQDCLDRLAILEERLKNAKTELRINSKEYRPLKKVYNEYERNLAKYRRKNAQVAKMKTDLYGVNNYVDLDKEEAQKLANEIDVLDGLRLSINHCEQVINDSKDRYPILEHTNKILTEQIAEIEQDIEANKAILAKIREEQGEGAGEGEGENN